MFQMIMPCFIIAVTRLCFVYIAHNRCAYLDTCCLILSCTVSICLSLVCSGLKYSPVVLFFFAKRIQSYYYYYYQLSSVNVTMSTLILSIFLSWSTNHSSISFEKAVMGNSIIFGPPTPTATKQAFFSFCEWLRAIRLFNHLQLSLTTLTSRDYLFYDLTFFLLPFLLNFKSNPKIKLIWMNLCAVAPIIMN